MRGCDVFPAPVFEVTFRYQFIYRYRCKLRPAIGHYEIANPGKNTLGQRVRGQAEYIAEGIGTKPGKALTAVIDTIDHETIDTGIVELEQLRRRNAKLEHELEKARTIIDVQKKLSSILAAMPDDKELS